MISVDEARARILAGLRPTPAEIVALAEAWNRVTAAPVIARLTQPPADVSAMDGYALRAADGTLHATLTVIGAAPAGHPFEGSVGPGQTVRLFTGSVVPQGADAILLQEDATRDGDTVRVNEAVQRRPPHPPRRPGFLPRRHSGARRPPHHRARRGPRRRRQPPLAQRASPPARRHPGHRRRDRHAGRADPARRHRLLQLARAGRAGARRRRPADRAADRRGHAARRSPRWPMRSPGADMLVTTGGASVGDHDLVIAGLQSRGMVVDFWQIAMRPGKPLLFGRLAPEDGGVPVLGLPGNPVSAMVCAILFLLPALSRLSGLPAAPPPITTALLGKAVGANDHRADHLRATVATDAAGRLVVTPFPVQDSAMLRRLALADALILRPPHAPALPEGAEVPVIRLDSLGL